MKKKSDAGLKLEAGLGVDRLRAPRLGGADHLTWLYTEIVNNQCSMSSISTLVLVV
jgi:hypothetical protein